MVLTLSQWVREVIRILIGRSKECERTYDYPITCPLQCDVESTEATLKPNEPKMSLYTWKNKQTNKQKLLSPLNYVIGPNESKHLHSP